MGQAVQWLRSMAFVIQMYAAMALLGVLMAPMAVLDAKWARLACRTYARYVRWTAGWMVGLKSEVRGQVPTGPVLVAAKHQSFFDIILIFAALPYARFVMKKELLAAPFLGQYARRIGCVAVDRGKRGKAIKHLLSEAGALQGDPGQLVIYAQGTRVAPGQKLPYKVGAGVLYEALEQPCVPVATNVGVFWPRRSILRKPGLAVVEFLPPIAPDLAIAPFMQRLETEIETASDALMREAGFDGVGDEQD
ncbi:lysophospholipid acyltransferase family protein [Poseidonocella sedimentorum]|uniref:1-acyl-sn-glycerol-3-phosphate acyltransferase n=1 Tax=Poseidonocella sedimentorum TaxID=871652 RepID=A0A1I6D9Y4_9RHOB|nr:lysophospholipid acyltransferase family protein [Poseidonocella sedimentorum]SFR02295.1 1-acyl-sn-glycerol-3-phosphate acyltransferase [Poseidonocella sedimentorum]